MMEEKGTDGVYMAFVNIFIKLTNKWTILRIYKQKIKNETACVQKNELILNLYRLL